MYSNNYAKIYGILGKVLLGCAGAIVGYVTVGAAMAVVGVFVGAFAGHLLEKFIVLPSLQKFNKKSF